MRPLNIDLNADVGESGPPQAGGEEARLLEVVTSANVACGGHAGDEASMQATLRLLGDLAVAAGAHPSYPDPEGFGRRSLALAPEAVEGAVFEQVARLDRLAQALGVRLRHVKPHGALYHDAARTVPVATAVARGAARARAGLRLVGPAGSDALRVWRDLGFDVLAEAFADRRYEADGALRSRGLPGALIEDADEAADQALCIVTEGHALAWGGARVPIDADTLCIHSDTPHAARIARAVRSALVAAGVSVRAPPSRSPGP